MAHEYSEHAESPNKGVPNKLIRSALRRVDHAINKELLRYTRLRVENGVASIINQHPGVRSSCSASHGKDLLL